MVLRMRTTDNPTMAAGLRNIAAEPVRFAAARLTPGRVGDRLENEAQSSVQVAAFHGIGAQGERVAQPPKLDLPACGVLCDILWWARRSV